MEISKNIELMLLLIIKKNGAVQKLIELGYTYSQIANLSLNLEKHKLICFQNNSLVLTELGDYRIHDLQRLLSKKTDGQSLILPENKSKIKPIGINIVYLPDINKKH